MNPKNEYDLSLYDYDIAESFIAVEPVPSRDASRLMVINRTDGSITHTVFSTLIDHLQPGDVVVRNNSRVFPARLYGYKPSGARVEFLLLEKKGEDIWEVICRPAKKLRVGDTVLFADRLKALIVDAYDDGKRLVRFEYSGDFWALLEQIGHVPLPPYIKGNQLPPQILKDRYQTVFAVSHGSAAAPTAGLHFTPELNSQMQAKGISIVDVTLHVGLGTFSPIKTDNILDHVMHEEAYEISADAIDTIAQAKRTGNRVVAIGTTTVRVLESVAECILAPDQKCISERTSIFIYPGYQFKIVDALVTNFHLPCSSLLLLVSAFYDRKRVLSAYEVAKKEHYRFYSFGDAMFLV